MGGKRKRMRDYTDKEFIEILMSNYYMVDVLEYMGYNRSSGTMTRIAKERAKELNLDLTHFKGQKGSRGGNKGVTKPTDVILVKNSTYTNNGSLKKRLFSEGLLDNKCYMCGLSDTWNNLPITLHLDHIDGDNTNNTIENLRILCPNCHTQTSTYGSKNVQYQKNEVN